MKNTIYILLLFSFLQLISHNSLLKATPIQNFNTELNCITAQFLFEKKAYLCPPIIQFNCSNINSSSDSIKDFLNKCNKRRNLEIYEKIEVKGNSLVRNTRIDTLQKATQLINYCIDLIRETSRKEDHELLINKLQILISKHKLKKTIPSQREQDNAGTGIIPNSNKNKAEKGDTTDMISATSPTKTSNKGGYSFAFLLLVAAISFGIPFYLLKHKTLEIIAFVQDKVFSNTTTQAQSFITNTSVNPINQSLAEQVKQLEEKLAEQEQQIDLQIQHNKSLLIAMQSKANEAPTDIQKIIKVLYSFRPDKQGFFWQERSNYYKPKDGCCYRLIVFEENTITAKAHFVLRPETKFKNLALKNIINILAPVAIINDRRSNKLNNTNSTLNILDYGTVVLEGKKWNVIKKMNVEIYN